MSDFMIRFLICNILFCGIISILLLMKHILKNCLSSRMQYNLWFLLLGLLTVPFLPSHFFKFSSFIIFSLFEFVLGQLLYSHILFDLSNTKELKMLL